MSPYLLDQRFWQPFLERHYDQAPVVLPDPFPAPLLDLGEAFRAYLTAAERFRAGKRDGNIRVFRHGVSCALELAQELPEPADRDLLGYAARMQARPGGDRFGVVLNHVQSYLPELWLRLRDFLFGFFQAMGLPAQDVEAVLFLGNYDCTPFGVHRDHASVFQFLLHGHKEMRLWDDRALRPRGFPFDSVMYGHDRDRFHAVAGEPLILRAGRGQTMYWPSRYWHVGGARGELSIGLSVGLFTQARVSEHLWQRLAMLLGEQLGGEQNVDYFAPPWSSEVPAVLEQRLQALARVAGSEQSRVALSTSWLQRLTGAGCSLVPPLRQARALADGELLESSARYPIRWFAEDADTLVCVANGHVLRLPAHPSAIALLAHLNQGICETTGALVERFSAPAVVDGVEYEASPDGVRMVLDRLYAARALESR